MRNMIQKFLSVIAIVMVVTIGAGSAMACTGKTILIGSKGTPQQDVLAQVLALFISERTGTTVKVLRFDGTEEIHQAILDHKIDMYVEYTGVAMAEILKGEAGTDAVVVYSEVKNGYVPLNLTWLEPLGFEGQAMTPTGVPAQAAPVVRVATLEKFPALRLLVNRLQGAFDQEEIDRLTAEAQAGDLSKVVRAYMKKNRLI